MTTQAPPQNFIGKKSTNTPHSYPIYFKNIREADSTKNWRKKKSARNSAMCDGLESKTFTPFLVSLKNLAGHVSIEFLKLVMGFLVEFAIKVQGKRGKKAK